MPSLIQTFTLNVVLRSEHVARAKVICQIEGQQTVSNSPVALAIRDKLIEQNILFSQVQTVHSPLNFGSYTKLYDVPFDGKLYTFQAEHPQALLDAYQTGISTDGLNFQLSFRCIGEGQPAQLSESFTWQDFFDFNRHHLRSLLTSTLFGLSCAAIGAAYASANLSIPRSLYLLVAIVTGCTHIFLSVYSLSRKTQ